MIVKDREGQGALTDSGEEMTIITNFEGLDKDIAGEQIEQTVTHCPVPSMGDKIDVSSLHEDQLQAYAIITHHLVASL